MAASRQSRNSSLSGKGRQLSGPDRILEQHHSVWRLHPVSSVIARPRVHLAATFAAVVLVLKRPLVAQAPTSPDSAAFVRVNQVGYPTEGPKVAVVCALRPLALTTFRVEDERGRVIHGPAAARRDRGFGPCVETVAPGLQRRARAGPPSRACWALQDRRRARRPRRLPGARRHSQVLAGNNSALTQRQFDGAQTFLTLKCSICHTGAALSDEKFHDVAVAQIGPGEGDGASAIDDFGRMRVTGLASDKYLFRTTPLRNVELTGPYGHNGSIVSLHDFVEHYSESDTKLLNFNSMQLEPALRDTFRPTVTDILTQRDTPAQGRGAHTSDCREAHGLHARAHRRRCARPRARRPAARAEQTPRAPSAPLAIAQLRAATTCVLVASWYR